MQAYLFGLDFPILQQVSPRQFTGVLQGIAAGIGISDYFLRAFSWCVKNIHHLVQRRRYHVIFWHY